LPNVGPYIYDVSISGFTRSSIYEISSLRVKVDLKVIGQKDGEGILVDKNRAQWAGGVFFMKTVIP